MLSLMERIDRVFDAPIEYANRMFGIPADVVHPNNRRYQKYEAGIHWMEASVITGIGGVASIAAGVEFGGMTTVFSFGLAWAGLMKALQNCAHLK